MLYDLSKHIDRDKAVKRMEQLKSAACVIELKKKVNRSLKQNAYIHLILGWFGAQTGYTLYESKLIYKRVNKDIFIYEKNGQKFIRSSAELDTAEMSKSIDVFRDYSNNVAGIYLPQPDEANYLREIEIELSRQNY